MSLTLSSPAFAANAALPARHTCDGSEVSSPLRWSGVPVGARSLALIVDDPDAPDPAAPQRTWVHWVLYDLPPTAIGLPEGVTAAQLPAGTHEGINGWGHTVFKLYALGAVLPDLGKPDKAQLLKAMAAHELAHAELVGMYQRVGRLTIP